MSLIQFIPIRYFSFLIIGIVLGLHMAIEAPTGFLISGMSLFLLGFLHNRKLLPRNLSFEVLTAICLIGIGSSAASSSFVKDRPHHYSQFPADTAVLRLKLIEEVRSGTYNNRFIARVCTVNEKQTSGKILLYIPDSISFLPETELLVFKHLQPIRPPLNPGQFDYRSYMALLGIYDELHLETHEFVELGLPRPTLLGRLRILRQRIAGGLSEAGLTPSSVATTEALLLGQRHHLNTALYDAYKDAGAVHILAVSGLHIGILVLILKFVFRPLQLLRNGERWHNLTILFFLWVYAVFTGLSPSVVRAVTLFSFIGYAWMIQRPVNMYNILAVSFFFVLLVIQPAYLFQAGFQMSYAAVLAIIWIYPKIMSLWHPKLTLLKRMWQILAVSIAAQLGVLPISLMYFHQFPGLFFLSNLLILPILSLILGLGIVVIVMTQLSWQIDFINLGYDTLVRTMNRIVEWIGSQETFIFRDVAFDLPRLVLAYCFLIALILFLETRKFRMAVALTVSVLLFQSWVGVCSWKQKTRESLDVFHSVKHSLLLERQGDTIRVHTTIPQPRLYRLLREYQLAEGKGVIQRSALQNIYSWGNRTILIIDEAGVFPKEARGVTHIVLTQSPRLHLERVLMAFPRAKIIADGSNYPSSVRKWRESCMRSNRPFHYTGQDGAYRFQAR